MTSVLSGDALITSFCYKSDIASLSDLQQKIEPASKPSVIDMFLESVVIGTEVITLTDPSEPNQATHTLLHLQVSQQNYPERSQGYLFFKECVYE